MVLCGQCSAAVAARAIYDPDNPFFFSSPKREKKKKEKRASTTILLVAALGAPLVDKGQK